MGAGLEERIRATLTAQKSTFQSIKQITGKHLRCVRDKPPSVRRGCTGLMGSDVGKSSLMATYQCALSSDINERGMWTHLYL